MTILSEDSFQNIHDRKDKLAITVETACWTNSTEFSELIKNSLTILIAIGLVVIGTSIGLTYAIGLGWPFSVFAIIAYLFSTALVLTRLRNYPYRHFGAANIITAIRSGITCLIAGALFDAEWLMASPMAWGLVVAAAIALCLDGVDGYVARYSGTNSEFGARYDMEVDAALILCLSILAFLFEKAGWWVILIGCMRYLFVVAQYFDSRLQKSLKPSLRRQAVCVLQIICLGLILTPIIEPPISTVIAVIALIALCYSFARDVSTLVYYPAIAVSVFDKSGR